MHVGRGGRPECALWRRRKGRRVGARGRHIDRHGRAGERPVASRCLRVAPGQCSSLRRSGSVRETTAPKRRGGSVAPSRLLLERNAVVLAGVRVPPLAPVGVVAHAEEERAVLELATVVLELDVEAEAVPPFVTGGAGGDVRRVRRRYLRDRPEMSATSRMICKVLTANRPG